MIVGERAFLYPNVSEDSNDASNSKRKPSPYIKGVYPAPVGNAWKPRAPLSEIGNGQLCARAAGVRRTYMARIGLRQ